MYGTRGAAGFGTVPRPSRRCWSNGMQPRIKVLTLAVGDLGKALGFYRDGLGLPTEGIIGEQFENGAVVFIPMNDGMILALWPAKSLSKEAKVAATEQRLGAIAIGHIVRTKAEV